MGASHRHPGFRLNRRQALLGGAALLAGCKTPDVRSQSPEAYEATLDNIQLVRDLAVPFGTHPLTIESAGLVVGLQGTGGDPPTSPERALIMEDMQKRQVENPNQVLASGDTALVMVRGNLTPGMEKGDRFDVDVWVPPSAEASSIQGGLLLEARLREMAVNSGRLHEGHVIGAARGPVLVDPMATDDGSNTLMRRGRVLGGGVCFKKRPLGLMLKKETRSAPLSAVIGKAINQRFSAYVGGRKEGVATPKTDGYVELLMHPRYKDNVFRYLQVVRSVPIRETPAQRLVRLKVLRDQLHDPITSASAALRLEAIGDEGIPALEQGLEASDAEIRFYSAEALAYLDQTISAAALGKFAHDEPAFRAAALTALGSMDDPMARDELEKLFDARSVETRYGAFRALTLMNRNDPLVRGEDMAGRFSYHVIQTSAEPMIHVTRSFRPELTIFGSIPKLALPLSLDPSQNLMVNSTDDGQLSIARFEVGRPDEKRVVAADVESLVRGLVELDGTYPDVVTALVHAKRAGVLNCRLEVDALPSPGKRYEREQAVATDKAAEA